MNNFIREGEKLSSQILSENGSLKYSTSNSTFIDDFCSLSKYREPRSYKDVSNTMEKLWAISPKLCVKLALYVRLITRGKVVIEGTNEIITDTQKGQGLKNEGILRFMWLAQNHLSTFKANIHLFIAAGSWKDIFIMLEKDLENNGWNNKKLPWNFIFKVIESGLSNPETSSLVCKYLPTIRCKSHWKTDHVKNYSIIGKWLMNRFFKSKNSVVKLSNYRTLKSGGDAHKWQQMISKQLYNSIDFNSIAGRALMLIANSKLLVNHDLVNKYCSWLDENLTVKFTGYVHELFRTIDSDIEHDKFPRYKRDTINKQFLRFVEESKKNTETNTSLLVVRDISGSMTGISSGAGMSAYDISKALALYFSYFLSGHFQDSYAIFSNECKLKHWEGKTPVDRWISEERSDFGSTNFLEVAKLFVSILSKGVSEKDFPTGILAISDGEFDRDDGWCDYPTLNKSSFDLFRQILIDGGFSKEYVNNFKLILWDIPNDFYRSSPETKFEDFADSPNNYHITGYDPSVVSFILNGSKKIAAPKNNLELFNAAVDQDLLNKVKIYKDKI